MFQGWTFPVPEDDLMSCEGHESPILTPTSDALNFVADRPLTVQSPTTPVCRAVTGSETLMGFSAWSAGANALQPAEQYNRQSFSTLSNEDSTHGRPEQQTSFEQHRQTNTSQSTLTPRAPDGLTYLSILGGAPTGTWTTQSQTTVASNMQNYATSTDCILQNLTMVVGNPSLRCFANAPWRAFTWVCALLQETSTQPWGTIQEAVQESIDTAEPVDLQALPGLRDLWKQHDLNTQGDANHFVNSLWLQSQSRAFHYRFAEIREGGYLTDHVQQPILVPFPDDWPDNVTFQQLVNNWANQGMGQYLLDDKKILVCHVTRNTCIEGEMTKHQKPFNPYGTFTVPRSLDGFSRTSTEFVPAVLICHKGRTHHEGHYFAILIYRDLMWIADDGKVPQHLPHLTPALASQITQVWAVNIDCFKTPQQVLHGLPPADEPDFDPPLHPSPVKRARYAQDHNSLYYANVTNLGKQVIEWYWTRDSGIYIFVETHLDPQKHWELSQYFSIRGRTVFGTPAEPNQEQTGTHGGIMVIADPACGLTPFQSYTNKGCGYQSFLWQATETTILVVGLYLRTGETFQSDINSDILAPLLSLLTQTTHPYVLIGDWQNPPSALASTVLSSKFHFGILAPDHSVLSGNTIDYAVLHNSLAGTTSLQAHWAVPWRPHALLQLTFDIEAATMEYRQMPYFPPMPKVPDIDFRPWTTYQSQANSLDLYGIPPNEAAQAWADWLSKTEQYLLQENPWAAQGRGHHLQAVTKPLMLQPKGHTWRKGRPAFWDQIKAVFHLALQTPPDFHSGPIRGFHQRLLKVPQQWIGAPTWSQFLDTRHHWIRYRDPHAADLILQTMTHQLQEAQQHAQEESTLQYRQWLQEGHQKGLRGLFRSLKSSELAWERPYRMTPMPQRMNQRLADWGGLWKIRQDNDPAPRPDLKLQAQRQAQTLAPITPGQLQRALKAMPERASGPDAVSVQMLKATPPLALTPLLQLLHQMERMAELPTQLQMHLVVMLPKNQKLERPITLTSTLWRLWCRLRKPLLDQWQRLLPETMSHDKARPGANVLHVALARLLRQEVTKARQKHGITVLMDMSTFYDTINLCSLQEEAIRLDYPPLMLELAMQLYCGPKAILAEQELTPFFHVDHGVPAGCPQAPLLAKAVLAPALIPWKDSHPTAHLSSWVDDVGFDLEASTALQVAQQAVAAYRDLHTRLTALGLKVNPKKTAFIATDRTTEQALKGLLTDHEPPVSSVTRDLGIDHQAARRRRIPVMRQRFQKAKQRRVRLRTLKIPALKVRLRLHRGGIQPVALWGVESQGLAPRYRIALRQALATQLGHHAGGLLDITYDLHSRKYLDPADQVIMHHIKATHTLYHTWPTEQLPHLQQAWATLHAQLQAKQHPWYVVKGHMAATLAYLLEWQWQAQDLQRWHRTGHPLLLDQELTLQDPWWKLERALKREAKAQHISRLAGRPHHQHLVPGLDWHVYGQVMRTIPGEHKPHLRTWTQAALHYKEGGQIKECPICKVPATVKHILWLCKWHHAQKHQPMPAEWAERILSDDETPLWTAGWIPLEPQEARDMPQPYQGHGAWQGLQQLAPHPHQGWAFTLDATPSSYDQRDQLWIFGLCAHTMTLGQLQRLAAITGAPPAPHTKARALMEGLVALAKHTTTQVRVIVQLISVWEAWTQERHRGPFLDQLEQLTESDYNRVTVLYVPRNTKSHRHLAVNLNSEGDKGMQH